MTIPVELALSEFLFACKADGKSPHSITWYEASLSPFAERFKGKLINEFKANDLRIYLGELRTKTNWKYGRNYKQVAQKTLSVETIRGRHRALKRFFNWCMVEYDLDTTTNPMLKISMPKSPQRAPKAIDFDDLMKLLSATGTDVNGLRNRAMIAFMADTGCRLAGMVSLRMAELDLPHNRAIVTEKGNKTRVVPFGEGVAVLIQAWLNVRPPEAETVFCSLSAKCYGKPLTGSGVRRMLIVLAKKAGIKGRVNPHSFRHGFAREYLRNGGDLATLAQLMGHSNVLVTASAYAVFNSDELARQHSKFSPLRAIGKEAPE